MITRNIRQICHFSYLFRITHFLSHKSAQLTSTQILHWTKFPLKTLNLNTSICFFHFARQAHELWELVTSVIVPIPWNPETSRNNMNRDMIGRTIITSLLFFFIIETADQFCVYKCMLVGSQCQYEKKSSADLQNLQRKNGCIQSRKWLEYQISLVCSQLG